MKDRLSEKRMLQEACRSRARQGQQWKLNGNMKHQAVAPGGGIPGALEVDFLEFLEVDILAFLEFLEVDILALLEADFLESLEVDFL